MTSAKTRLSPIQAALHQAAERRVTSCGARREGRNTPRSTASSARTINAKSTHTHGLTGIATSFGEEAVDELHAAGAFTDRRGDAFHAASANIADREDARDARLEKVRRARQWPAGEIVGAQVGPRLHESLAIERHGALEPSGVRTCAGHQEQVADRQRLGLVRLG